MKVHIVYKVSSYEDKDNDILKIYEDENDANTFIDNYKGGVLEFNPILEIKSYEVMIKTNK